MDDYSFTLKPKFYIGQPVYIKTDPEQEALIVIAYRVGENDIMYECSKGIMREVFSGVELSEDKNVGQYG